MLNSTLYKLTGIFLPRRSAICKAFSGLKALVADKVDIAKGKKEGLSTLGNIISTGQGTFYRWYIINISIKIFLTY